MPNNCSCVFHPAHYVRCVPISSSVTLRREYPGCGSIMYASIPITSGTPELRPSICISIRGLSNVIESGVGVVGGPDDHRRSSGITSRAFRNVLTTSGLFYRFAKRHIVTFDRSYVYHACLLHIARVRMYLYVDTRRQGRVSFRYIQIYVCYIILCYSLFLYISISICSRFLDLRVKYIATFSVYCYFLRCT